MQRRESKTVQKALSRAVNDPSGGPSAYRPAGGKTKYALLFLFFRPQGGWRPRPPDLPFRAGLFRQTLSFFLHSLGMKVYFPCLYIPPGRASAFRLLSRSSRHDFPNFSWGVFLTMAFAVAAPLHSAFAGSAMPAAVLSATYHIERHNQKVSVEDANGKALAAFSAATPSIQGSFTWSATVLSANKVPILTLTLKDGSGRSLWSTPVSVVYPQTIAVNYNSTAGGTLLSITATQNNTPDPDYPPASGLLFTIGQDGRPISFGDAAHQYKYIYAPHGFSVVGPDGKTVMQGSDNASNLEINSPSGFRLHMNLDGTGTMQLNGMNIPIEKVTKDSKVYVSFPWNGHTVLIEQSCNWNITSDGDLTINAPTTGRAAAIK